MLRFIPVTSPNVFQFAMLPLELRYQVFRWGECPVCFVVVIAIPTSAAPDNGNDATPPPRHSAARLLRGDKIG
ncbi:hypothetical protein Y032_0108g56 [Ancylostoma ceylanicum]|uniref:Uncharacterized protein n=1 Tax=Ancylostoma ceylanicum TaxID=53326 RepID=A0A016TEE2_9BILA|nr:hypothetical protein Y032_0108g56 [Ancylostoma ceylanicum]